MVNVFEGVGLGESIHPEVIVTREEVVLGLGQPGSIVRKEILLDKLAMSACNTLWRW